MIHDPNSSCVLNVYFRPITLYSVAVRSDFGILVSTQLSLPFRIIAIGKLRNDVSAFENRIDCCFSIFLCLKIFKPLITLNRISYYFHFHVRAFFSKLYARAGLYLCLDCCEMTLIREQASIDEYASLHE